MKHGDSMIERDLMGFTWIYWYMYWNISCDIPSTSESVGTYDFPRDIVRMFFATWGHKGIDFTLICCLNHVHFPNGKSTATWELKKGTCRTCFIFWGVPQANPSFVNSWGYDGDIGILNPQSDSWGLNL